MWQIGMRTGEKSPKGTGVRVPAGKLPNESMLCAASGYVLCRSLMLLGKNPNGKFALASGVIEAAVIIIRSWEQ